MAITAAPGVTTPSDAVSVGRRSAHMRTDHRRAVRHRPLEDHRRDRPRGRVHQLAWTPSALAADLWRVTYYDVIPEP
jgi:hypothetical protein